MMTHLKSWLVRWLLGDRLDRIEKDVGGAYMDTNVKWGKVDAAFKAINVDAGLDGTYPTWTDDQLSDD